MSDPTTRKLEILPGDIYEDCAYHPVLCILVSEEDDEIAGISLIDGSYPRSCSLVHCGVRKLSVLEALRWKFHGPDDLPAEVEFEPCHKWWRDDELTAMPFRLLE